MEYRSKSFDVASDGIGSHGRPVKIHNMYGKKTTRGNLDLDNALAVYDGQTTSPKDSYEKQDKKFVREISTDLL